MEQNKNTKNILLDAQAGESFANVAREAFKIAYDKKAIVEFDFNGIQCLVGENTYPDLLYRDYTNAHLMDWKTIGPKLVDCYSSETLLEMAEKTKIREQKETKQRDEWKKKEATERKQVEEKTKGQTFECTNLELWQSGKDKNQDPYGGAVYDYAEKWALLMQAEMANGKPLTEIASSTSFELGYIGISGFMYGAAVSILSSTWKHGEELRKWHNKDYGHSGDGVVNPAILTVG